MADTRVHAPSLAVLARRVVDLEGVEVPTDIVSFRWFSLPPEFSRMPIKDRGGQYRFALPKAVVRDDDGREVRVTWDEITRTAGAWLSGYES